MRHQGLAAATLTVCMTVMVAGCGSQAAGHTATGSTTTTATGPSPAAPATSSGPVSGAGGLVKVENAGYGMTRNSYDGTGYVWAAAVLKNTSADTGAQVSVRFTAYGGHGKVIDADSSTVLVRATQTGATGVQFDLAKHEKVDHITVQPSVTDTAHDAHPDSTFTAADVRFRRGPYGDDSVTGTVTSHYQQDVSQVQVDAVCEDAHGKIVGGGVDYLDSLASGATTGVSVNAPLVVTGTPDHCQLYPSLSPMSKGS